MTGKTDLYFPPCLRIIPYKHPLYGWSHEKENPLIIPLDIEKNIWHNLICIHVKNTQKTRNVYDFPKYDKKKICEITIYNISYGKDYMISPLCQYQSKFFSLYHSNLTSCKDSSQCNTTRKRINIYAGKTKKPESLFADYKITFIEKS